MTFETDIKRYINNNPKSKKLHDEAKKVMPGGDTRNSIYWNPFPIYLSEGKCSKFKDIDNNIRVDLINNMTTLILGHNNDEVRKAIINQTKKGTSFSAPTSPIIELAKILCERVKSVEKIRFVNSGTEATLNAIRASRAFTHKQKIVKCEGAYHGNHDAVQISVTPDLSLAGSKNSPKPVKAFEGIANSATEDILIIPFNNDAVAEKIIVENAEEIAAVIVEPINGQCGMIPAKKSFLEKLRYLTKKHNIVLIFDEVISFRISSGGAQEYFDIYPDITCFGKVIGGGMPVGAFGGNKKIMNLWDPSKSKKYVQHAGTFNGNPITATAGLTTLKSLKKDTYEKLNKKGDYLRNKLSNLFLEMEAPLSTTGIGSLFAIQCTADQVTDYRSYSKNDQALLNKIFISLLNSGFLISNRCSGSVSVSNTYEEIDSFVLSLKKILSNLGY